MENKNQLLSKLPRHVIEALTSSSYDNEGADYSVTDLINPPQIVQLRKRWGYLVDINPEQSVQIMLGHGLHDYLHEFTDLNNGLSEHRISVNFDDITISGQADWFGYDGHLVDYKLTKVRSLKGDKSSWIQQLNMYKFLIERSTGRKVTKLSILAFLKDHSKTRARLAGSDYPKFPIAVIDIPIWEPETTEAFIKERIRIHEEANFLSDTDLPECSKEDRWITTTFAVKKFEAKKASRVFDSREEADAFLNSLNEDYFIEEREGDPIRCIDYCEWSSVCSQYRKEFEDFS